MQEINMEKINEFLAREDLEGHEFKLRSACLAADAQLKMAVQDKERLLGQLNALNASLSNIDKEIIKLNGKVEGCIELISSTFEQDKGEQ